VKEYEIGGWTALILNTWTCVATVGYVWP